MRLYIILFGLIVAGSSCGSTKSTQKSTDTPENHKQPVYLKDMTVGTGKGNDKPVLVAPVKGAPKVNFSLFDIETGENIQFKYAIKMDIEVEKLYNSNLYEFIDYWWGTPYKMGGSSKKGIDCSAFTQILMSSIYELKIPRTANEQNTVARSISIDNLKEGDLIFFNTRGRGVSHVGIYLHDNKFVHAATSQGVMISSLTETYWNRKFIGAGRMIDEKIASHIGQ